MFQIEAEAAAEDGDRVDQASEYAWESLLAAANAMQAVVTEVANLVEIGKLRKQK